VNLTDIRQTAVYAAQRLVVGCINRKTQAACWWGLATHPHDRSEDGAPYARARFTPFGGWRSDAAFEARRNARERDTRRSDERRPQSDGPARERGTDPRALRHLDGPTERSVECREEREQWRDPTRADGRSRW